MTIRVCEDCGHDEIDHGHLSEHKPYVWGCSKCDCKQLHPAGEKR